MKPAPNQAVLSRLEEHGGELATASTVWHELLFGIAALPRGRRRHQLERYLLEVLSKGVVVLPYDRDAAAWQAAERARLKTTGRQLDLADGQIAAVAAVNDLTLITANVSDFAALRGLTVADWRN